MLRLMMYNEYVLRHNLVKVEDESYAISKARMALSFHHLLIIGVESMIIGIALLSVMRNVA